MKTFKKLTFVLLFVGATFTSFSGDYYDVKYDIKPTEELAMTIKRFIRADFAKVNNFFYQRNINRFKESVTMKFYITSDKEFKLLSAESNDDLAEEYIKELFKDVKFKLADTCTNHGYKLEIILDYRT